jgi:hypothetical protein
MREDASFNFGWTRLRTQPRSASLAAKLGGTDDQRRAVNTTKNECVVSFNVIACGAAFHNILFSQQAASLIRQISGPAQRLNRIDLSHGF